MLKFMAITLAAVSIGLIAASPADARGGGSCCCVQDTTASADSHAAARPDQGGRVAQAPQSGRRYSYDPSMDAPSTRTYQPRSYGSGMRARSSAPAWALQKTNDAKYRVGR